MPTQPISRDEYERVVTSFIWELQGIMAALSARPDGMIQQSSELLTEINELKDSVQDPDVTNEDIVGFCFGILDEYLGKIWDNAIGDGYQLYQDMHPSDRKPS